MNIYDVNIARLHPVTKRYEHWGLVSLGDVNEAEARSKFARIISAFPAPGWGCTLRVTARSLIVTLDNT